MEMDRIQFCYEKPFNGQNIACDHSKEAIHRFIKKISQDALIWARPESFPSAVRSDLVKLSVVLFPLFSRLMIPCYFEISRLKLLCELASEYYSGNKGNKTALEASTPDRRQLSAHPQLFTKQVHWYILEKIFT